MTCAVEPSWSSSAFRSRTSAAERTNESAMKSHPSSSANSRSSRSFRVSAGIGIGTPGRLTPLWEVIRPPTSTAQRARPSSTSSTWRRIMPSSTSTSWPGRRTSPIAAGAIGSSPSRPLAPTTTVISVPVARSRGSESSPTLNFGPWRSPIRASGRPARSCAPRTSAARSEWSSCVPWERLSRAASIPDSTSASSMSGEEHAGPIVATILVRLGLTEAIDAM